MPSGHAAYAAAWVAIAIVFVRGGRTSRARLRLVIGLVVAAAVGLSRVELHAHWFTDVAAGWALGAAIFGCAASRAGGRVRAAQ